MDKSDLPKTFTAEYYDQKYFADSTGKTFRKSNGTLEHWGYHNPDGESLACLPIMKAWKTIFQPQTMLDVGCVLGDSMVLTQHGYSEIQNIKPQSELISGTVLDVLSRDYTGKIVVVKSTFLEALAFTPEHPILVAKRVQRQMKGKRKKRCFEVKGFVCADELIVSSDAYKCDYLIVPKCTTTKEIYLDFPKPNSNHAKTLGTQLLDNVWAELIGWYLAEGCIDGRVVSLSLGKHEMKEAEEILKLAREKNLNGDITVRNNALRVRIYSVSFAKLLSHICGKGAKNKHLPEDFICWNREVLEALIFSYVRGDGNLREKIGRHGKKYREFKVTSASKQLIKEIQYALFKIGYPSSFYLDLHHPSMIEGRQLGERYAFSLCWTEKPYFGYDDEQNYYFKITALTTRDYSGKVYNLRTSTETYHMPFVVHNCGRGTLVAYAREAGIEAYGFDFSEWGINEGRYPYCKPEWLTVHDATKPWPYLDNSYDLVVALDLMEHIYLDDLDFVISELYRVTRKWIFLQTAVAGSGGLQGREEDGYILKKGEPVPIEFEGCAVAGHVTLRKEAWWYEKFEHENWMPRKDMVNWFTSLVDPSNIKNWLLNSMIVLEKIE